MHVLLRDDSIFVKERKKVEFDGHVKYSLPKRTNDDAMYPIQRELNFLARTHMNHFWTMCAKLSLPSIMGHSHLLYPRFCFPTSTIGSVVKKIAFINALLFHTKSTLGAINSL